MSTLCAVQKSLLLSRNGGRRVVVTSTRHVANQRSLWRSSSSSTCSYDSYSFFATSASSTSYKERRSCPLVSASAANKRYNYSSSSRSRGMSSTATTTTTTTTADISHSHSTTHHIHEASSTSSISSSISSSSLPSKDEGSSSSTSFLGLEGAHPDEILQKHQMTRNDLMKLAHQTPTPLRLADMYQASGGSEQRLRNAQFLHKELPIRTAQRAAELLSLPHGLSNTLAVQQVAATYISHLTKLQRAPVPNTPQKEQAYTLLLQSLILDRASIPMSIARGMTAWNEELQAQYLNQDDNHDDKTSGAQQQQQQRYYSQQQNDVEDALYRFFTARVGLRFLIEHFVLSAPRTNGEYDDLLDTRALKNTTSLFPSYPAAVDHDANKKRNDNDSDDDEDSDNDNLRGCIQSNIDLVKEVGKVADLVIQQTMEYYGQCPAIDIVDCIHDHENNTSNKNKKKSQDFCYVPNHLHYIMAELLKNSCRATVKQAMEQQQQPAAATDRNNAATTASVLEQQLQKNNKPDKNKTSASSALLLPPIRVVIVKGEEDVTIKIADKGGGIPRSRMSRIWRFAHSTADETEQSCDFGTDTASGARIRGFGLPLARIYSRYFGGELTLKSMEGYGLDAYLHLPRLGDGGENLPLRVRSSPGARDSMPNRLVSSSLSSSSSPPLRTFHSSTAATQSSCSDDENDKKHAATAAADNAITLLQKTNENVAVAKKKAQRQELSCFWELGYYDPQELLAQEIRQCVLQQKEQQLLEKNKLRQYYHANAVAAAGAATSSSSSSSNTVAA